MAIIFIAAAVMMMSLSFSLIYKLIGLALIILYGAQTLWRYGFLRDTKSVQSIQMIEDKKWRVSFRNVVMTGELLGDSTVTSYLSVLRFKFDDRRYPVSCIVFRDSLPKDQYRDLIVTIRMG